MQLRSGIHRLVPILVLALALTWAFPCRAGFDDPDPAEEDWATGGEETPGDKRPADPLPVKSRLPQFFSDATWTLGYAASVKTGGSPEWIDNHIFLRQELQTLVRDRYFIRLDWKGRLYPKSDHNADAGDRDLRTEADLREAFIQTDLGAMNLKLGSQIIVWGKADTAAVTDVASPRDRTRFIFPELEDMRFGQWAASAHWFRDKANLFIFVAPLPETDRLPDPGTHYFRPLLDNMPYDIHSREPGFGDGEAGAKLEILFGKTDLSLMAGRFHANAPVYDFQTLTSAGVPVFNEIYPAYTMAGAALAHARENFLFKAEMACKLDFPLQGLNRSGLYRARTGDLVDTALGLEYNANDRYQVHVELTHRHLFSPPSGLIPNDPDRTALYLTLSKDLLHQTLDLEYNCYYQFQDRDLYHNFKATWDLTDTVQVRAQYTLFNIRDTDSLLGPYRTQDRLAVELRYAL